MADRNPWDFLQPTWVDKMGATAWDPPNLPLFPGAPWPPAGAAPPYGGGQAGPLTDSSGFPFPTPPGWPNYIPGPNAPQQTLSPENWAKVLNAVLGGPASTRSLYTPRTANSDIPTTAADPLDGRSSGSVDDAQPLSYGASVNEPLSSFELAQAPRPQSSQLPPAQPVPGQVRIPRPRPRQAPQLPPLAMSITTPWMPKVTGFTPEASGQPFDERWSQRGDVDPHAWSREAAAVPPPVLPPIQVPNLQKHGFDSDDIIKRIVRAENAQGNPDARNPATSATGLGQFTKGTWRDLVRSYRRDLFDWWLPDPEGFLELRTDPALSRQMVGAYADQHAKQLSAAGLPVTKGTLYLAHHFGFGDARSILNTQDPNTPLEDVLSPEVVRANADLIRRIRTIQGLKRWADDVIEHGPGAR